MRYTSLSIDQSVDCSERWCEIKFDWTSQSASKKANDAVYTLCPVSLRTELFHVVPHILSIHKLRWLLAW